MRKFLYGVIVGVAIMGCVHKGLNLYENLNSRVSAIEGYLQQLDRALRGQSSVVVQPGTDRIRA